MPTPRVALAALPAGLPEVAGARAARTERASEVLAAAVTAFVEVRAARAGLLAAERQLEALEAERARAERFFTEGAAPRVQLLRASAALEEARAWEGASRAELRAAEHDLARLIGLDPDSVAVLALADVDVSATVHVALLKTSSVDAAPGLEAARQRAQAAQAAAGASWSALFPRVEGVLGFHEFGSASGGFVGEWQVGVQVGYQVFGGGARRAATDQVRAATRSAQAAVEIVELELLRGLDRALAAHVEAYGRRQALEAAVEQYEEVARIEALSLAEGVGLQRDLLAAEAELFRTRSALAVAHAALAKSAVEIASIRGDLDLAWITRNLESRP